MWNWKCYFASYVPVSWHVVLCVLLFLPVLDFHDICENFQQQLPQTCWGQRIQPKVRRKWSKRDTIRCDWSEAARKKITAILQESCQQWTANYKITVGINCSQTEEFES